MIIGKGAGIILLSKEETVLLQYRDENNKWNRNSWSEFGGQIEAKETPRQAIKREIKEELAIDLLDIKFFKEYKLQRKNGIYKQYVFVATINHSVEELRKQQQEGKDLAFFNYQQTKKLKIADYTKKILKDFFSLD